MRETRKILVTGASGFIGTHLTAALAARGYEVRAVYRRAEAPAALSALASRGVELFKADLSDGARVREAVSGVDAIIHVAALASDWGPFEPFRESNYDATVSLIAAARGAGVKRFVYFSSAVVAGFGNHVDTTEEGPCYRLKYPYQITKQMTEEYVLAQDCKGFRTIAIRPCNVYGPGDYMSTYQMYEAIMTGVFGYIGSGEAYTCPIFIDDLCSGVIASLEHEELGGEAIILTDGQKVPWKDYVEVMFRAVGSTKRPTSLPVPLAYAAAGVMTSFAKLFRFRKAPPLTLYRVEQGSQNYHFSNEKARRLLGFEPKTFYREGLEITARAFLAERKNRS